MQARGTCTTRAPLVTTSSELTWIYLLVRCTEGAAEPVSHVVWIACKTTTPIDAVDHANADVFFIMRFLAKLTVLPASEASIANTS